MSAAGRIVAVYGNLVTAEIDGPIRQNAVTYCLRSDGVRLMSEIIRVRGRLADMRVYEREFPQLQDPRTGRTLMERTIIICNTSSMPVAARESSVYTAVTMGEYYRQLGLDVLLLADSTSRWAQALREMSGRLEEIPGEEAFPAFLGLSYARRLGPYLPRAGARGSSR